MSGKTVKKRQPQAHHAATAAAHCTNHYTRSVMQLESVVKERLAQLNLLAEENSALKRREAALQSAVGSLAGSVSAATRAVLVSSAMKAADALHTVRPVSPEVRCSIADHKSFLLRMQQRETAVQRIMSQLGCVESEELYSSWLLRRAFSSPERAACHLAMSKVQRVANVLATVQKLGLLVGKYDLLHHPSTAQGTPREQLDRLVDDLNERTLAFCLLAPPHRQLEMACLNLETGMPEPYPRGWWAVVIDAMQLTDDQKAALKICWDKVKPIKLALTAKYETLSTHQAQLQRKQLDQQHQFELQAEHAIDAAISRQQAAGSHHRLQDLHASEAMGQQQPWQQQQQDGQYPQQDGQQQQQQQQHDEQFQQQWQQWQQQQQPLQQQQQPLQQQQQQQRGQGCKIADDHELFQFCRCLLGSELEGVAVSVGPLGPAKDVGGLSATATSAQQQQQHQHAACCQPASSAAAAAAGQHLECHGMAAPPAAGDNCAACAANATAAMDADEPSFARPAAAAAGVPPGAPAAHQQQQQWYAARMAPLQQPQQQQQHFMEFSPAVAAAAAASDLNLWLGADMMGGHPSPGALHPALGFNLLSQSSDSHEGRSPGHELADDSEDMLVDGSAATAAAAALAAAPQASSSLSGVPPTSRSADSKVTTPNSSPCAARVAVGAGAAAGAEAAAGGSSGQSRPSGSGSGSGNNSAWQDFPAGGAGGVFLPKGAPGNGCLQQGSKQQQALVLQTTDREQRKLEKQMDRITAQLKMQQYCMHTYVLNICSKKQMALKYVNCWPWVPESFSMCEALDELGWQLQHV